MTAMKGRAAMLCVYFYCGVVVSELEEATLTQHSELLPRLCSAVEGLFRQARGRHVALALTHCAEWNVDDCKGSYCFCTP
jgi:hypothetical protein